MRHSKRQTLSTEDINSALVASGKEVWGWGFSAACMHTVQIPATNTRRPCRMQPIYGYGSRTSTTFASAAGVQDTYFVQDPISDVQAVSDADAACLGMSSDPSEGPT